MLLFLRPFGQMQPDDFNHPIGDGAGTAGVLTTATGVTFSGDVAGNVLALRTSDGTTLWHQAIERIGNAPISYELNGRQYLVVGGGNSLYAFALPAEKLNKVAR